MPQKETVIISTHVATPKRERVKFEGTDAEYVVQPVPHGKKRVMAIVDGRTVHVDVPR